MKWHYQVNDRSYFSKLEAIKDNLRTGDPIRFEQTPAYSNYDFSKEPNTPLNQLLRTEAEKIRASYKKIRLYLSGGIDSVSMLRTFIHNKIHIDEIVILKSGIKASDYEIDNYALPIVKKYTSHLRETKITISEPSMADYTKHWKEKITEDRIKEEHLAFNTYSRILQSYELSNEENNDPEVCNLFGIDKPKLIKKDNEWYTVFLDQIETYSNRYLFFSQNPELHCKQSHLFMNALLKQGIDLEDSDDHYRHQELCNRSTGRYDEDETFSNYPDKVQALKGGARAISFNGQDLYYVNLKEKYALEYLTENHPEIINLWQERLQELKVLTSEKWWNGGRPNMGTLGIWSKFYCLTSKKNRYVEELWPNGM